MSEFLKRLITTLPLIFGVVTITFSLIHFIPGDPIDIMLGDHASVTDKAALRKDLGLDKPLLTQYIDYLNRLSHFDFGRSIQTKRPVLHEILQRLPATFELTMATLFFSLLLGIPLGIFAAIRKNQPSSYVILFFAMLGLSMPAFWLGPLLIWLFSLELQWLPISERGGLSHLVLPALTLSSGLIAIILRMTTTSMLNVLREDYILVAKAKGVGPTKIHFKHALYNAIFPLLTITGLIFAALLTGTVIIETIFDWPGLGQLIFESIQQRDYPLVQGCVLLVSLIYIFINFLTDLSYQYFNPKVKEGFRG